MIIEYLWQIDFLEDKRELGHANYERVYAICSEDGLPRHVFNLTSNKNVKIAQEDKIAGRNHTILVSRLSGRHSLSNIEDGDRRIFRGLESENWRNAPLDPGGAIKNVFCLNAALR